jgi:hypothetical protein
LEVDLYAKVEPTPLLCYPTVNRKGYYGLRDSEWILKLIEQLRHVVVLLCDGFEEQLSALFAAIIANKAKQGLGFFPKGGKKNFKRSG